MAKKVHKHKYPFTLRLVIVGLVTPALFALAIYPQFSLLASSKHQSIALITPVAVHQTPVTPALPPPPPPKPAPTPKTTAPVYKARQTSAGKPQPIVTPSPSSNVSGLEPVAPATGSSTSSTPSTPDTAASYTSTNWSGYMVTNGTYHSISGSWDATQATGIGSTTSADSTWIGIGGVSTSDLVQVGTDNIINASGQVTTQAFYELLPQAELVIPDLTVTPGDSMTASLSEVTTGQWLISITDKTDSQSFSTTVAYTSSYSSAEWIEEDPSYSFRRLIPFDNFHTAIFASGLTELGGAEVYIANSNALPVTMVDKTGQTIASPSALTGSGSGFTVTRTGL